MNNITKKIAIGSIAFSGLFSIAFLNNSFAMGGFGHGGGHGGMGGALGRYISFEEKEKLFSLSGDERDNYIQNLKEKYGISESNGMGRGRGGGGGMGRGRGGMGGGQGGGKGNGMGRGGRGGGQGGGRGNRQGHAKNFSHAPGNLINNIPAGEISQIEKELLINQYGEEKMARDLYAYAAKKYPNINSFSNITESEQQHMDSLKVLLDRYNIEAPSDYAKDNDLFVTLKNKIDQSEKDAIEVGITVEMVDIDNIVDEIKSTDNDDIKIILTNIGGASYNHLKGFVNALQRQGYSTDLKWTNYISEDDLNVRGGRLKTKLVEKLELEGVDIPSNTINNNHFGHNFKDEENGLKKKFLNFSDFENKKQQYKKILNKDYAYKINTLDEEKLELVIKKINLIEEKIKVFNGYSENKKIELIALLEALKELIVDKMGVEEINIDDLLQ